jgi:hypothetical protein
MIFFNQIINAKGTPSIYEDTLANRPAASSLGRLFVRTDNPYGIYRDQGTSWQLITGSGGGGSQNWDDVLSLGGYFTADRSFQFNNKKLAFLAVNEFNLQFNSYNSIFIHQDKLSFYNTGNSIENCFLFDYLNANVYLGDFSKINSGVYLNIDSTNKLLYTGDVLGNQGLYFDFYSHTYHLGDPLGKKNTSTFTVSDGSKTISTKYQNQLNGLSIDFTDSVYYLGDIGNVNYGYNIKINSKNSNNPYLQTQRYGESIRGLLISELQTSIGNTSWTSDGFNNTNDGYLNIFNNNDTDNFIKISGFLYDGENYLDGFGIKMDYKNSYIICGDYDGINNGMQFIIRNPVNNVSDMYTGTYNYALGFYCRNDGISTAIGDIANQFEFIDIELLLNDLVINRVNTIHLNGNVTSSTSGSTSSQHLVVYINGTQYKIQLRNP